MAVRFPVPITKMSGAGNDFIIIDNRHQLITSEDKVFFVTRACRRNFAAGADGVIFIEESETADFRWDFYNMDGSIAEMCGNGARCAARFATVNEIAGNALSFETIAGTIEAEVCEDDSVKLKMTDPTDMRMGVSVVLGGVSKQIFFVNTGVPHAVIFVDDEATPIDEWGPLVRFEKQFEPAGTNATFVTVLDDAFLRSQTYERGVEEETKACGTGAVAAAIIGVKEDRVTSPVRVITSGGEELVIHLSLSETKGISEVYMQGPARIIYQGELTEEAML